MCFLQNRSKSSGFDCIEHLKESISRKQIVYFSVVICSHAYVVIIIIVADISLFNAMPRQYNRSAHCHDSSDVIIFCGISRIYAAFFRDSIHHFFAFFRNSLAFFAAQFSFHLSWCTQLIIKPYITCVYHNQCCFCCN